MSVRLREVGVGGEGGVQGGDGLSYGRDAAPFPLHPLPALHPSLRPPRAGSERDTGWTWVAGLNHISQFCARQRREGNVLGLCTGR